MQLEKQLEKVENKMKLHVLFIGNKFVYNRSLKEYILRNIENEVGFVDSVICYKSSDHSLFLYLEEQFRFSDRFILVTSKKNFSTVGKLICTATSDNQVVRDGVLVPQKASHFEERSYLLEHKDVVVNVLQIDAGDNMPMLLLSPQETEATIHIFEEEKETLLSILLPIAQMYEVSFDVTMLVKGWLRVDITSKRYGNISQFIHSAKKLLPKKLITSANIISHIIERLSKKKRKVSFAESCTGGLLAYKFTKMNGASKILNGSLVTYSNDLKENWLGISHETITQNGAVSRDVVSEMSEGVMNVSYADYTLSVSGIAGDSGGTIEKPVGTVYIGVRSKNEHKEEHLLFDGDRNYVQEQSALYAIKMLLLVDKEIFF